MTMTTNPNRDDFLKRISQGLGRDAPPSAPVSASPPTLGPPEELHDRVRHVAELMGRDSDNLMNVLARTAEASNWNVVRVADAREAGLYARDLARDLEARSVVHSLHPIVRNALAGGLFDGSGVELTPVALDRESEEAMARSQAELRVIMEASDLAITGVDYAIAETGTAVIIPRAGASRLVSLVPPVHLAIVERGQVLPSLDELFTLRRNDFANGRLGSYMNLITGPSRSADIEYQLITGVHGPGEVHMVLVG